MSTLPKGIRQNKTGQYTAHYVKLCLGSFATVEQAVAAVEEERAIQRRMQEALRSIGESKRKKHMVQAGDAMLPAGWQREINAACDVFFRSRGLPVNYTRQPRREEN